MPPAHNHDLLSAFTQCLNMSPKTNNDDLK